MKLGAVAPRQSGCRARPGMHDPVRCAPAVPPEGAGRRTSPVDPGASLPSRAGQFLADHPCRVQAPGGVRRRHPDVDDRQLRTDRTDQGEQFCTVPCLADHVEPERSSKLARPSRSRTSSSASTTGMRTGSPVSFRVSVTMSVSDGYRSREQPICGWRRLTAIITKLLAPIVPID